MEIRALELAACTECCLVVSLVFKVGGVLLLAWHFCVDPTTYSIVPGVFFGCVASAFIATSGSVWMIWPGPETPEASHPASPEEIPLQRLDGHDLPPMIQPVRLQQASPAAGDDALQEDEQWRRLQTESETAAGVS
eukprot:scpid86576/ scgid5302/ 